MQRDKLYLDELQRLKKVYNYFGEKIPDAANSKISGYESKLMPILKKENADKYAEEQKKKAEELAKEKEYEKQYVDSFRDYLIKIGAQVTIITQELNNFSASDRLPSALLDLKSLCNDIKRLSSPSDRFDKVDELVQKGADEYLNSIDSIGRAVTSVKPELIDQGVAQSKTAGDYFKQAKAKLNSFGYKL